MSKLIRWPKIGDLIIQKSDGKIYSGLVYEDTNGGSTVFIEWGIGHIPPDYWPPRGYASMNIHNLTHTFDVIKTHM